MEHLFDISYALTDFITDLELQYSHLILTTPQRNSVNILV